MSSLHNDFLEQQYENDQEEIAKDQDDFQKFITIQEFCSLVLSDGPNAVLSKLEPEAKEELLLALKGV